MGIILDTSLLIAAEKQRFDMPAFLRAQGNTPVAIAAITASELLHGWERAADPKIKRKRGRYVKGILSQIPIVPFGLPEAREHARLWAHLAARGEIIGAYDLLVAATALRLKFSLATLNRKEFERVPKLRLANVTPFIR